MSALLECSNCGRTSYWCNCPGGPIPPANLNETLTPEVLDSESQACFNGGMDNTHTTPTTSPAALAILERYLAEHPDTSTIDQTLLVWTAAAGQPTQESVTYHTATSISRTWYTESSRVDGLPEIGIYASKGNWDVHRALARKGQVVLVGRYLRTDWQS